MTLSRVTLTVLVALSGLGWSGASEASVASDVKSRCRGEIATIVGTSGKDDLRGTKGRDVIVGLAGDDRIDAGGGDDLVCGGDGRDRIRGGSGDDRLLGQRNGPDLDRSGVVWYGDTLEGGPGDDVLLPGYDSRGTRYDGYEEISHANAKGPVVVDISSPGRWGTVTGEGNDRIRLGEALTLIGSAYDDTMTGSAGDDYLMGGLGNDVISGLAGRDTLEGGPVRPKAADDDVMDAGEGADEVITYGGRDVIHAGPGGDQLGTFGKLPVQIYGDEGNDDILGFATGESGYLIDGGPGHDAAELSSPVSDDYSVKCCPQGGAATFDEATGAWQATFLPGRVSSAAVSSAGTALGIEDVTLGAEFAWTYVGTEGPDVVVGGYYFPVHAAMLGGDDIVGGSESADTIDGGPGHDKGYLITAQDAVVGLEETSTYVLSPS